MTEPKSIYEWNTCEDCKECSDSNWDNAKTKEAFQFMCDMFPAHSFRDQEHFYTSFYRGVICDKNRSKARAERENRRGLTRRS